MGAFSLFSTEAFEDLVRVSLDKERRRVVTRHHIDVVSIGPVDYEYTVDKAGSLIGGASDERETTT